MNSGFEDKTIVMHIAEAPSCTHGNVQPLRPVQDTRLD
ncbi:unnamed protein product [Prunus brigantina]